MAVPLLSEVAFAQLQMIKVENVSVKLFASAGAAWNVGEYALVYAKITNTTGLPLRDVYLKTFLWGTAAAYQPFYNWDGNGGLIGKLEPMEVWNSYMAFLKAVSPGQITIQVKLCAEVVPYVCFWPAYGTAQVYPS